MDKGFAYLFFLCCLLQACRFGTGMPDLRETYSSKDTKPFGAYIAKRMLETCYPDNYVQNLKDPFETTAQLYEDSSSVYFCMSRNLFLTEKDVDAILGFVYNGNTAFFSSANFDSLLLNKIFCKTYTPDPLMETIGGYDQTSVKLLEEISQPKDSFSYYYRPFASHFTEINDRYSRIIGYNARGKTNCMVFFWGKGKLFLHTDPRALSNYFLLTNDNYKYMQSLVQVMNPHPQHVYWNDYYYKINRKKTGGSNSSLSEIFKYPSLTAAFWLLLLMFLLYILFGMKRKQRVIKEIKPNENSSVVFTETIARLYLQKHDNKNIADKMITYFNEFIRNNYYLNTNTGSKDFITALSRKSGVSEEKTTALFHAIDHANQHNTIDDYQLLSLNQQIQEFYKKRK